MTYEVQVLETLRKVVKVNAHSPQEARDIVSGKYYDGDVILGGDDFYDVEFFTQLDYGREIQGN